MLEGLERRGALRQIWGSFTIGSWLAFGPLAEEPEPLELKACRDYLEKIGYDGLFMDEFITKDSLIGILQPLSCGALLTKRRTAMSWMSPGCGNCRALQRTAP